MTVASITP